MSSEPSRASLLRALFKMEPPAAAAEALGGASEFVKGENGPGAPLCAPAAGVPLAGASLGNGTRRLLSRTPHRFPRLRPPAARTSLRAWLGFGPLCPAVFATRSSLLSFPVRSGAGTCCCGSETVRVASSRGRCGGERGVSPWVGPAGGTAAPGPAPAAAHAGGKGAAVPPPAVAAGGRVTRAVPPTLVR